MNRSRFAVMAASLGLLGVWIAANFERLTGEQHGMVRFVLGTMMALLILFRGKGKGEAHPHKPVVLAALGVAGVFAAVGGLIFNVLQVEWVGIILLLYACWRWAMPASARHDILWALFLLYWVHPLPALLFARIQLAMQAWSVATAEWLLHALNVRVWADGFTLYSGFNVVGVPDECSGMRTALTVLLCALGIGVLFRFRAVPLALLVLLGLAQVILLNGIRIAGTMMWAPKMPREWSDGFLHETLGLFLMVSIVLTSIEASAWQLVAKRRKRIADGIARDELERPQRATRLPRFWHLLMRWARVLVALAICAAIVVAVGYKSRTSHRDTMRLEIIDGLIETDLDAAERAIAQHLRRKPSDRELLAKKARVQVLRREFAEALVTFDAIQGGLNPLETTLKAWSLMAMGRVQDAVNAIDRLPLAQRELPGVAMVRAEFAAIQGDPRLASRYIVRAVSGAVDPNRVRALYAFLAKHEQWDAIAKSNVDQPFTDPNHALIAAHACMRVNDLDGAVRTMRRVMEKAEWANDPRFLRDLFMLALRKPNREWSDRFDASFRQNYARLDADQAVAYIGYCFQLNRPDLAWLSYLRLLALDARHPDVFYTPAVTGDKWFAVRRHHIGVEGGDPNAVIDMRAFAAHTRNLWPFTRLWDRVPLANELGVPGASAVRDRYMKWTLVELEARERAGTLTRRGELIFPNVLATEGRFDEAHRRLDGILAKYPFFAQQAWLRHAELYDQEKRWDHAYEALREYYARTEDLLELKADLLMVNALLNLNLGVYAMDVAERAARSFPGVGYTDLLRAAIWDIFGFKEDALFALRDHDDDVYLFTAARLNAETGRLAAADRLYKLLGSQPDRRLVQTNQTLLPLPAEMTITRRWPAPPNAEARNQAIAAGEARLATATSPFVRALATLTLDLQRQPENAAAAEPALWRAAGRDAPEQATALHRLAALQAREGHFEAANVAAREAVALMPASAILRRILIALTEGDPAVVAAARAACPDDPEIWLASLVSTFRAEGAGDWALAAAREATTTPRYAPGAVIRAGDFFLRQGLTEAAALLARDAIHRASGLVSAHMLGLRCALNARDAEWALDCAHNGISQAIDPSVFYRSVVEIKTIQATPDRDLLEALEYLKERFPKDLEWKQYLGHVYFQKGDPARAFTILEPVIAQELAGVRVRSLLLAAEAARVAGYDRKAVDILERALALHPDQLSVLNNLVYNLAQRPETAPRAAQLLPKLLEIGGDSFAVLDTAAMVYLRNGRRDLAQKFMARAIDRLAEGEYAALETRLNAAEIQLELGQLEDAAKALRAVRQDPRLTRFLETRARRLEDEVLRRQRQLAP